MIARKSDYEHVDVVATAKVTDTGLTILGGLGTWIREHRAQGRNARKARALIGVRDTAMYSYRVAMNHPLRPVGDPHPDDRAAFCAVVEPDMARALESGWLDLASNIEANLSDSMILIGSPEAEALCQLAFGYRPLENVRGTEFLGNVIDLPYRWHEDGNAIEVYCKKYTDGQFEPSISPAWAIESNVGARRKLLFPNLSNDGFLATDYLLITKVPNYLTKEAYESGHSIVSIAGTHGTGTRSIDLLLHNNRELAEIGARLSANTEAFQILLRASHIRHVPGNSSRAQKIEVADIQTFERSYSSWLTASKAVSQTLTDGWGTSTTSP